MFDAGMIAVLAPFLMVVGIVWVRSKARIEEKRIAAATRDGAQGNSRDAGRIDELEDRVRILERIVTAGGYDLARKIEALRDERPIGQRLEAAEPEARI